MGARVQAAEDALARQLGAPTRESETTPSLATLVTAGMARMLALLRSVGIVHPSLRRRHGQQSTLITLADRLVTAAAALELTAPAPLRPAERARLQRIADECGRVRRALATGRPPEPAPPRTATPGGGDGSAAQPALAELEHVVDLLRSALETEDVPAEVAPLAEPRRLFVPDAFTNPEYRRYALKGSLAVLICYVLYSAVDWPGIRTCIVTCMIVGLTSEGATIQKATLRFSGALVGGADGLPVDPAAHPGDGVDHVVGPAGCRRGRRRRVGRPGESAHLVCRRADRPRVLHVRDPGLRAELALRHHPGPPGGNPARQRRRHAGVPLRVAGRCPHGAAAQPRCGAANDRAPRHGRGRDR